MLNYRNSKKWYLSLQVPILGVCYGLQEIAWNHGKQVSAGDRKEYGHAVLSVTRHTSASPHVDALFAGLELELEVWMSHGDKLARLPPNFLTIATTSNAPFAGIVHKEKPLYGIQFHPEVTHTAKGKAILENFAIRLCQCRQNWTMEKFVDTEIERIRAVVGPTGQVIGAVSGGVDSTVAAKLMHTAIGDRFHAILVDNGVMRLNECQIVHETLTKGLGINLAVVDASEEFLSKLKGVVDPEKKRKIIGNTFIEVFQREAERVMRESGGAVDFLLQGTLYPDVIESISFKGPSATIKTHHVREPRSNLCGWLANPISTERRWSPGEHETQAHRAPPRALQRRGPHPRNQPWHS